MKYLHFSTELAAREALERMQLQGFTGYVLNYNATRWEVRVW